MKRTMFLSGTAMALALVAATQGAAATCIPSGLVLTCDTVPSDPVASATANQTVVITTTGSVVSDDRDTHAIALAGDASTITNDGTISQTDIRNNGYAITGTGNGLAIVNSGLIESGDRAIEMLGGSGMSLTNSLGATVSARRQTVRSLEGVEDAYVLNAGTIRSEDGRALQLRGNGATVINYGDIIGGEEVIEARGDFYLENYGNIYLNSPTSLEEDGVQFANGEVQNHGSITGSDDGIDIDEGKITNHSGAVILSTAPDAADNSGIDIDPVFEDGVSVVRPAGPVLITNAGRIEGPSAIGSDPASESEVTIVNTGQLVGRGAAAIRLASGQGDSELSLSGASEIIGDVLFGAGDDLVRIGAITSGLLAAGVFDGSAGFDTVMFDGFDLLDFGSFDVSGNEVMLSFLSAGDLLTGRFLNFETWSVGGTSYSTAALSALLSPAQVPLPAGLPLLLVGLGGLALVRRRKFA